MPSRHAELSPSAAARWIGCPGSVRVAKMFPDNGSIYAAEGTIAHSYLESLIKEDTTGQTQALEMAGRLYEKATDLSESAEDMKRYIDTMYNWLLEELYAERAIDPTATIYSEQEVDLSRYIPAGFGTTDVTIARQSMIHILDLKYGKGVAVDAEDNPQLRLYALGMLEDLDAIYEVEEVRMTIYQPRLNNISTVSMSARELRTWGREVVKPAAHDALQEDAPTCAGSWCKFCPGRALCRTRADYYTSLEASMHDLLSNDEIGAVLDQADGIVTWVEELRKDALAKLLNGEEIKGWKPVEGRSVRAFSCDETEIVKSVELAGWDSNMLYDRKIKSLAQIEKVLGKAEFAAALGEYVTKPTGKPTLAPVSDKRPVYNKTANAINALFD